MATSKTTKTARDNDRCPCIVYATCPDEQTASAIAAALVSARVAACVNILPNMKSMYEWEGKVEQSNEVVLIAKSTLDRAQEAVSQIKAMHPYDVPALFVLEMHSGDGAFLDWLTSQTATH